LFIASLASSAHTAYVAHLAINDHKSTAHCHKPKAIFHHTAAVALPMFFHNDFALSIKSENSIIVFFLKNILSLVS